MATNLHRVYQNFIWRIESIPPTCTRPGKNFVSLGNVAASESTGTSRGFRVKRQGRETESELTDLYQRTATHDYRVEVYYPSALSQDAIEEIISQDAHDIIKTLRDPASYLGFNSANNNTNIGVRSRMEISDQVNESASLWTLQINFKCLVTEIENA
jgi:hypothetical protein